MTYKYDEPENPTTKRKQHAFEKWLDNHNHTMEFMRTIFSFVGALTGCVIFLKVFGII